MLANLLLGLTVLTLLALVILYQRGRRYLRHGEAASFRPVPGPQPPVAVIIPVAGASSELRENLRSRLTQDYPDYQVIFAVQDQADPACPVIRSLLPEFPQARLVLCGPAAGCGQKNHNLLMGLQAVAPEVEVLVFADANQRAPRHWLAALVQPLIRTAAEVSSSFHHLIPLDNRLGTLGRCFTVFMIYVGKGIAGWDQPWGGSTAIRREVFYDLQVDRLWSRTVVDDVTLAKRLRQAGIKMAPAAGGVLATPVRETLAGWENWFTRQVLYLKFYFPLSWALAGLGLFTLVGIVSLSFGQVLLAAAGFLPWLAAGPSGLFLLTLTILVLSLRTFHPRPGPMPAFLAAAYLTLALAAWCHGQTWFTRELHWRNRVYTVNRRGEVSRVRKV